MLIIRFEEAACLLNVSWLEIKARINFHKLSAKTKYAAYLIFRTKPDSKGLGTVQKASVSIDEEKLTRNVCLKPTEETPHNTDTEWPIERDGWMELELGDFYCDGVTRDKEAVVSIKEIDNNMEKSGLIVAGIEIRPIFSFDRSG